MPFFGVLLAILFYEKRRVPLMAVIALCVIFVSIWGVREYDRSLYSCGEYKYYAEYQPMRAFFGDGAFYDKESTFDELEERDMFGMDFYMLKSWMFYDADVFLLSYDRYKELGEIRNPSYVAIAPGDFNNIFSWGYWNIYLPPMIRELEKRGVKNPIRDIVHDNVYLLEDGDRSSLDEFYKEHYHKSLSVDTANVFGNLLLLKYRLSDEK